MAQGSGMPDIQFHRKIQSHLSDLAVPATAHQPLGILKMAVYLEMS